MKYVINTDVDCETYKKIAKYDPRDFVKRIDSRHKSMIIRFEEGDYEKFVQIFIRCMIWDLVADYTKGAKRLYNKQFRIHELYRPIENSRATLFLNLLIAWIKEHHEKELVEQIFESRIWGEFHDNYIFNYLVKEGPSYTESSKELRRYDESLLYNDPLGNSRRYSNGYSSMRYVEYGFTSLPFEPEDPDLKWRLQNAISENFNEIDYCDYWGTRY